MCSMHMYVDSATESLRYISRAAIYCKSSYGRLLFLANHRSKSFLKHSRPEPSSRESFSYEVKAL